MKEIVFNEERYLKLKMDVNKYLNGEFEPLYKPKNSYIIDIEGLDVSGKETFSKSLLHEFEERKYSCNLDIDLYLLEFPSKDNEVFYEIMDELNRSEKKWNQKELDALFAINRYYVMSKLYEKINSKVNSKTISIIICDRFYFSNVMYCHLRSDEYKEYFFDEAARRTFYYAKNALVKERNLLGSIDQLIMFFIGDKKHQRKLYEKKLLEKQRSGKSDGNETQSKQEFLNKIIKNFLLDGNYDITRLAMSRDCQPMKSFFKIAIGDNWGSTKYENAIIDALLYKIIGRSNLYRKHHVAVNSIEYLTYEDVEISNEYKNTVNDLTLDSLLKLKAYYVDADLHDNKLPFEIYCELVNIHNPEPDDDFVFVDAKLTLNSKNNIGYLNFILNKSKITNVHNFIETIFNHELGKDLPILIGSSPYKYYDDTYYNNRINKNKDIVSEYVLFKVPLNKLDLIKKNPECIAIIKLA